LEFVKLRVEHETASNTKSKNGTTRFIRAAAGGHENIVAYLLDKGAELHTVIKNGSIALMVAAERGHLEGVKVLMMQGANCSGSGSKLGWTPLMVPAAGGHTEIIRLFLDEGQVRC
jgi:ankyrin repeat protein